MHSLFCGRVWRGLAAHIGMSMTVSTKVLSCTVHFVLPPNLEKWVFQQGEVRMKTCEKDKPSAQIKAVNLEAAVCFFFFSSL